MWALLFSFVITGVSEVRISVLQLHVSLVRFVCFSPMVFFHDRMEQETPMTSGGLKWWAESLGSLSKSCGVRSG